MSYTTTDHLGSPRVITNSFGQVTSRRDFLPFGEELTANVGSRSAALNYGTSDTIRQKFTGYQKDEETSLDFAEARMYANTYGRFTAVDPLLASGKSGNPQTFNRYVYVLNCPLVLRDASGLAPSDPWGIGKVEPEKPKSLWDEAPRTHGFLRYTNPSTHIDADGHVIAVFDDGDNGVYQHGNNADGNAPTAAQLTKRHKKKGTSAGGKKIGDTQYWDEFVSPDTGEVLTNHTIRVGFDLSPHIEAMNKAATEGMDLIEMSRAARNNGILDIKATLGNIGALLNGLYVTSRSAGNYLAGYNAATGTLAGRRISFETFQKMAGALQVKRSRGEKLTEAQLADILIFGVSYGPAPTYGEFEYQRRMSVEGFMHGRPE